MYRWLRSWHAWIGVILAVPLVLVAATAILIAHESALGSAGITVSIPDLASRASDIVPRDTELRSLAITPAGDLLYGSKYGLIVESADTGNPRFVTQIGVAEIRTIAVLDNTIFVAARSGLWRGSPGGDWSRVAAGDFWYVTQAGSRILAISKADGLLESVNGGEIFAPVTVSQPVQAAYAEARERPPMTLNKLIMDIHTGKFFLGDRFKWLWIDMAGVVLLFISLSGLLIWRRTEKCKMEQQARRVAVPLETPQ